jgi:hypothetical protein
MSDLIAGGSLGLLVGMLLGLSTEPLVGTVMTGLVALLASFFGFGSSLLPRGGVSNERLVGFCVVAVVSGLAAIAARTHNILSPSLPPPQSIQSFVEELKGLNFPMPKIIDYVGLKYLGLIPSGSTIATPPIASDNTSATKFFAAKADDCNTLPQLADRPLAERLTYLDSLAGTPFVSLSTQIRTFSEDKREAAYKAGIFLLCGGH